MKKLLVLMVLAGLVYGTYRYLQTVQEKTAERQDVLKPTEKALKELDRDAAGK